MGSVVRQQSHVKIFSHRPRFTWPTAFYRRRWSVGSLLLAWGLFPIHDLLFVVVALVRTSIASSYVLCASAVYLSLSLYRRFICCVRISNVMDDDEDDDDVVFRSFRAGTAAGLRTEWREREE